MRNTFDESKFEGNKGGGHNPDDESWAPWGGKNWLNIVVFGFFFFTNN